MKKQKPYGGTVSREKVRNRYYGKNNQDVEMVTIKFFKYGDISMGLEPYHTQQVAKGTLWRDVNFEVMIKWNSTQSQKMGYNVLNLGVPTIIIFSATSLQIGGTISELNNYEIFDSLDYFFVINENINIQLTHIPLEFVKKEV